jgi:carbon monoxide dehydrogenase subunit G
MATSTATRSIDIDAPVRVVFAFVADPEKVIGCFPGRRTVVSDVDRTPDGVVASYRVTAHLGPIPIGGVMTRETYVPHERIVEGGDSWVFAPLGEDGARTRLTLTGTVSSPLPLLDKIGVFIGTSGRGQERNLEEWLLAVKEQVEAG